MNIAIILAGGIGSRVGAETPKQFIEVLGKPIIAYTIEKFQNHREIDAIRGSMFRCIQRKMYRIMQ